MSSYNPNDWSQGSSDPNGFHPPGSMAAMGAQTVRDANAAHAKAMAQFNPQPNATPTFSGGGFRLTGGAQSQPNPKKHGLRNFGLVTLLAVISGTGFAVWSIIDLNDGPANTWREISRNIQETLSGEDDWF